jgi:hypothetical protein
MHGTARSDDRYSRVTRTAATLTLSGLVLLERDPDRFRQAIRERIEERVGTGSGP